MRDGKAIDLMDFVNGLSPEEVLALATSGRIKSGLQAARQYGREEQYRETLKQMFAETMDHLHPGQSSK